MKLKIFLLISLIFLMLFSPALVHARKKLVRFTDKKTNNHPYGAWSKPKLRTDHLALYLILGGMEYADQVNYIFTYTSDSVNHGVEGSYDPAKGNNQIELVFGTCSNQDCTYHQNITDMFLDLVIDLQTGKTLTQKYQINP